MNIPFNKIYIGKEEKKAVCDVLDSGWVTEGKKVDEFEKMFAEYVGSKYAVATSSGTASLFLSIQALKEEGFLKRGSCIAVPSLTFSASASVIVHSEMNPVFVDVNGDSLCMSEIDYLKKKNRVDAYIDVMLAGNKSDWYDPTTPAIYDSAHLVERDCYRNNLQCFSFYPTKNMTALEGGMIATDSKDRYDWLKKARRHGMYKKEWAGGHRPDESRWGYTVDFCGWKCNMTDVQAAVGIEQLKKLDFMNSERQRMIELYNEKLGLKRGGLHLYYIFVHHRDQFMKQMLDKGIHCSVHFEPLHFMPAYEIFKDESLPETQWAGDHIVSLPLYVGLTNKEIDYICSKIHKSGLLMSL